MRLKYTKLYKKRDSVCSASGLCNSYNLTSIGLSNSFVSAWPAMTTATGVRHFPHPVPLRLHFFVLAGVSFSTLVACCEVFVSLIIMALNMN